jgi:serine/threonine protein kinase
MAPEILNGHPYNYKADIYSLGVSIFEALIGQVPFIGENKVDLTKNVNIGLIRIQTNLDLSSCCLDFLGKCLVL